MFFQTDDKTLSIFSDIRHREGGPLSPGEGAFGHPFEAFKKAASGEVIRVGGEFKIIPHNTAYLIPLPKL